MEKSDIPNEAFRILIFLCAIPFVQCTSVKVSEVPQNVSVKFKSLFPDAKAVAWSRRNRRYTADFVYNDSIKSLTLGRQGQIRKQVAEIDTSSLPGKTLMTLKQDYKGFKPVIALRRSSRRSCEYDVEIMMGLEHFILKFNKTGQFVQQYYVEREVDRNLAISPSPK